MDSPSISRSESLEATDIDDDLNFIHDAFDKDEVRKMDETNIDDLVTRCKSLVEKDPPKSHKDEVPNFNEDSQNTETTSSEEVAETIKREDPKIGRNDFVKITNGKETQEIKYKKAKPLIDSGEWRIV